MSTSFQSIHLNADIFFSKSIKEIFSVLDQFLASENTDKNHNPITFIDTLSDISYFKNNPELDLNINSVLLKSFYSGFILLACIPAVFRDSLKFYASELSLLIFKSFNISKNNFDQMSGTSHYHMNMTHTMFVMEHLSIEEIKFFINRQRASVNLASNLLTALILINIKEMHGKDIFEEMNPDNFEDTFFDFEQKLKDILLQNPAFIKQDDTALELDIALTNLKSLRGDELLALLKDYFLLSDKNLAIAKIILEATKSQDPIELSLEPAASSSIS